MILSYEARSALCTNPTAKKLFSLMATKKTNLALSADVNTAAELVNLADTLGPLICVLKTHIDILTDFTPALTTTLTTLAEKHKFLIFEDRKFADIGNTVKQQYSAGIYRIADWAPLVNAHSLPGPGIIEGLKSIGLPRGHGLLLLAEMSSKGALTSREYAHATLQMAEAHPDFVIGFITQHRLSPQPCLVHMTPGVSLAAETDPLGQQYVNPSVAIGKQGTDVIIVGRGIYGAADPLAAALAYQQAGWQAYEAALGQD